MQKSLVLGSLAALSLAGSAFAADGFSYNYVEGNYVSSDLNADVLGIDNNADGFNFRGAIAFNPMIHGYVDYTRLSIDVGGGKEDVDTWEVGVGVNHALNPNVDYVARVGYLRVDPEHLSSLDGFAVQTGLRTRPMNRVEFDGMAHYVHLPNFDSTTLVATGRYYFTDALAGSLGAEFGDHTTTWTLGVRYSFSRK